MSYFSNHALQLENDLFQSKFVPLLAIIDTSLSKTDKSLQVYQLKRLARDSEANQTQSLPPLNSLVDDPYHHLFLFPKFSISQTSLWHSGKVNVIVLTILLLIMYILLTSPPLFALFPMPCLLFPSLSLIKKL